MSLMRNFAFLLSLLLGISLARFSQLFWQSPLSKLHSPQSVPVSCANLAQPYVPGATILSITSAERSNVSLPALASTLPAVNGLDICEVNVTLTHGIAQDKVLVQVWLPLNGWNGRFQGVGGGGFTTGLGRFSPGYAVSEGFAAAGTDGGHEDNELSAQSWAWKADKVIGWDLLINFSSRSLHEISIVGKAITTQFYGKSPLYSYWNGCSTGGRQGHMIAQKYPEDYDGILANAPALYFPTLVVSDLWAQVVMRQENVLLTKCIFNGFNRAFISQCDELDGVRDGILANVDNCVFDASNLVGTTFDCDGEQMLVTKAMANVVQRILDGPTTPSGQPLWYGFKAGTNFSILANVNTVNGKTVAAPFPISDSWVKTFIKKDFNYDTTNMTPTDFADIIAASNTEYGNVLGTDNPNMSAFKAKGGKLLSFHGLIDPLIPSDGTVDYHRRVQLAMGGADAVDEFYRLFLAPGVEHCGGGPGPAPIKQMETLMKWVENGEAPDIWPAEVVDRNGGFVTRNLCKYPLVTRYDGFGDPNIAASYSCQVRF